MLASLMALSFNSHFAQAAKKTTEAFTPAKAYAFKKVGENQYAPLKEVTAENVVVPDLAIVKQAGSGDRYVFVYKDGKVSYNKVELGRRMGTEYELKSGVPDNSQVVVAGQSRLVNGMEVEVEASSQSSSK